MMLELNALKCNFNIVMKSNKNIIYFSTITYKYSCAKHLYFVFNTTSILKNKTKISELFIYGGNPLQNA